MMLVFTRFQRMFSNEYDKLYLHFFIESQRIENIPSCNADHVLEVHRPGWCSPRAVYCSWDK